MRGGNTSVEHFATAHKVKVPVTVCWLVAWLLDFFLSVTFISLLPPPPSLFLFLYESQSTLCDILKVSREGGEEEASS